MPVHDWTKVDAGVFHDFHIEWIAAIKHSLNRGVLPKGYYAMVEQFVGRIGPDVLTLQTPSPELTSGEPAGNGTLALLESPPKVRFRAQFDLEDYTVRSKSLVVRRKRGDEVVAIIVLVSSGNKSDVRRFKEFLRKVQDVLESGIHLLVIDLFPPTRRDPEGIHRAIWKRVSSGYHSSGDKFHMPPDERLTLASYIDGRFMKAFVEPVGVGSDLPEMPLFLSEDDYVNVPLEATYTDAFDEVPMKFRTKLVEPNPARSSRKQK